MWTCVAFAVMLLPTALRLIKEEESRPKYPKRPNGREFY